MPALYSKDLSVHVSVSLSSLDHTTLSIMWLNSSGHHQVQQVLGKAAAQNPTTCLPITSFSSREVSS